MTNDRGSHLDEGRENTAPFHTHILDAPDQAQLSSDTRQLRFGRGVVFVMGLIWCFTLALASPVQAQFLGVHLHNDTLDKSANKIQSTYSNHPPVKFIDLEEARLGDWAKRKAQLIHAQQVAIRDAEFTVLFQSKNPTSKAYYEELLGKRLTSLCGDTVFTNYVDTYEMEQMLLKGAALRFKLLTGRDLPVFVASKDISQEESNKVDKIIGQVENEVKRRVAAANWQQYAAAHQKIQNTLTGAASGGELHNALSHWDGALQARQDSSADADAAQKAVKAAQKALADALAPAKTNGWQTVFDTYTNYQAELTNFSILAATNLTARYALVTEIIVATDAGLRAIATRTTPTNTLATNSTASKIITALGQAGAVFKSAAELEAAIKTPPTAVLQIQLALSKAQLDSVKALLRLEDQRIALAEQQFFALWRAATRLGKSKLRWDALSGTDEPRKTIEANTLPTLFDVAADKQTKELKSAEQVVYLDLLQYADTVRIDEAAYRLAQTAETQTYFEASLVNNRLGVALWDGLIAEPINQIAVYHSGGIKPEVLADLFVKAAGFSAIAWRY